MIGCARARHAECFRLNQDHYVSIIADHMGDTLRPGDDCCGLWACEQCVVQAYYEERGRPLPRQEVLSAAIELEHTRQFAYYHSRARSTVQNRQSGVRSIFEFDRVMEVDMLPHPWDDRPRSPSKDLPMGWYVCERARRVKVQTLQDDKAAASRIFQEFDAISPFVHSSTRPWGS